MNKTYCDSRRTKYQLEEKSFSQSARATASTTDQRQSIAALHVSIFYTVTSQFNPLAHFE